MPNDKQNGVTQAQVAKLLQSFRDLQEIGGSINFDQQGGASFKSPFSEISVVKIKDPVAGKESYYIDDVIGVDNPIPVDGRIVQGGVVLDPYELTAENLGEKLQNAHKIIIIQKTT
jgi:hypothetical protein